jgi:hypothetical protein
VSSSDFLTGNLTRKHLKKVVPLDLAAPGKDDGLVTGCDTKWVSTPPKCLIAEQDPKPGRRGPGVKPIKSPGGKKPK